MKRERYLLAALSLVPAWASGQSEATQEGDLEHTVVVTETKLVPVNPDLSPSTKLLSGSIFETPRSVESVTREEFAQRGAQSLEDVLKYTPGVETGTYGLDTRLDTVRSRGTNVTQYRDGLQQQYGYYNNARQEVYAIEQVDVVKGPASLLFGRGTVGGALNTTSKIARKGAENEVQLQYGSFDRFQAGLDYNVAVDEERGLYFRLVGYYRDSDTQADYVHDNAHFIMPSFTWQPNEDTRLSVLLNFQEIDSVPSLQFFPVEAYNYPGKRLRGSTFPGEPGVDRYDTSQNAVSVIFEHRLNETFSLSSTWRYLESDADYVGHTLVPSFFNPYIPIPLANPGQEYHRIIYASNTDTTVWSGNVILKTDYETGALKHHTQFGVDFLHAENDRYTLPPNPGLFGLPYVYGGPINVFDPVYGGLFSNSGPFVKTDNLRTTEQQVGFFLHDRVEFDRFILSAGLRHDDYELESNQQPVEKQNEWSFDAGLMYQFENGVSPYYSYAQSFEPQGIDTFSNTALRPKSGEQHELGVKYQASADMLLTAAAFRIKEDDRAISSGMAPASYGDVEIEGIELGLNYRFYQDFYLKAGYNYLDTANNSQPGSPRLPGVPEQQASAWLTYAPSEGPLAKFRTGLGLRYVGTSWDSIDTLSTGSHTLVDLMVGYRWENLDLQLNISNLFDREYVQTQEYDARFNTHVMGFGLERSANLSATYRF